MFWTSKSGIEVLVALTQVPRLCGAQSRFSINSASGAHGARASSFSKQSQIYLEKQGYDSTQILILTVTC